MVIPIYSKSGDDHANDMLEVLGIKPQYFNKIKPLFDEINHYLDNANDKDNNDMFYDSLKEQFKYFNTSKYGHRLIKHWGFDIDIDLSDRQYPSVLPKLFEDKFIKMYGDDQRYFLQSEWYSFLNVLKDKQKEFNENITVEVHKYLGIDYSHSRDLAAILYYTHLLGDHSVHSGEYTGLAVLELNKIVLNLDIHVKKLADKTKSLYTQYKNEIKSLTDKSEKQYADAILDILKKYIPQILQQQYSSSIVFKKGFSFRDMEEELLNAS